MKTPLRNVRISADLWDRAKAKAEQQGKTLSDVIREALERFVK